MGKEADIGPTALTVADNVRRLRERHGMNYTQLSQRLQSAANWSINAVGIRRIESGDRRVTADDLMALAVALRVSPIALLMPNTEMKGAEVHVTGLPRTFTAEQVWEWLRASEQGYFPVEFESPQAFLTRSWPTWFQEQMCDWLASVDDRYKQMQEKTLQLMALREEE
ncbi:helix-turn-helix transcriptional regulator [Mycobacterium sp. CVI_P3]|uniref:Helix-turn-helix transcriptional regulator n=1 Tax=Mycobacterium pinniadriaticum TaxID=2994102 RepID=A0ABT3S9A0_9MYCO|nr:helix-turn-helix transcriptional regulator [Mycobacterium pinniadriaticum]MCX2929274.1 helix-turn-helix transcriptional regulator [Mycobacterium pinniadriaticum]MCX2935698.1 helix-turn-helix transcriptional regulator [Mycobacterium pinniadriaticum]